MVVFVVCMDRWMVCGRRRVMVNGWVDGWVHTTTNHCKKINLQQII